VQFREGGDEFISPRKEGDMQKPECIIKLNNEEVNLSLSTPRTYVG